ncbi:hypothetical protein NQT62_14670 [Limnobacter humi]|uniref:Lysozyme inhibitor LprI N-terminal domain-containing protein n=1 Tax=Limnobacter humi TaxID=1778671 RepID=A0ABT1WKY4_9BURK|nr:hypothetical protein [Limnobacter humi]MCQ8897682.1 hypothetical protein [Limnobacter humi]
MNLKISVLAAIVFGFTQVVLAADLTPCDELKQAKLDLQQTIRQVQKNHGKDKPFLLALKTSQQTWDRSVQANLALEFPNASPDTYGSVLSDCLCLSRLNQTRQRLEYLREWLKPVEEGDVCSGSRN